MDPNEEDLRGASEGRRSAHAEAGPCECHAAAGPHATDSPPPPLNDPGAAWLDEGGINTLSQLTEGINLVEKKREDQNLPNY